MAQWSPEAIPAEVKKNVKANPYLYYTYFYSLIFNEVTNTDIKINDDCTVADVLLYICFDIFNINPKIDNQNIVLPAFHEEKKDFKLDFKLDDFKLDNFKTNFDYNVESKKTITHVGSALDDFEVSFPTA